MKENDLELCRKYLESISKNYHLALLPEDNLKESKVTWPKIQIIFLNELLFCI